MLGRMTRATSIAGKPVIETRCVASGAVFSNSMSDRTLSDAARKCNDLLLERDVVETTIDVGVRACVSEDVGVVSSMTLACHGGDFKPRVIMRIVFVPCAFHVGTAISQTVGSERPMTRATLMLIIRSCWCYAVLESFAFVVRCHL